MIYLKALFLTDAEASGLREKGFIVTPIMIASVAGLYEVSVKA